MRARYGVDPEALGLAGPNAFADAFDASLRGMQLGESMATNALNRELAREKAEQIRQDRLAEATLNTPVTVGGGTASGGSGKSGSSASGVAAASAPMTFQDFVRRQVDESRQPVAKLRTIGDAASIWGGAGLQPAADEIVFGESEDEGPQMTLEEVVEMRDRMSVPEPSRVVDVPLRNPLMRIGAREDMVPPPVQARVAIFRDPTLSDAEKLEVARDYDNYYAQRAGQYQNSMAALMRAREDMAVQDAAAAAAAEAERDRLIQAGFEAAQRERRPDATPEEITALATANRLEREAFAVPTGEAQRLQSSIEANVAARMRAANEAREDAANRAALKLQQDSRYFDARQEYIDDALSAAGVESLNDLSEEKRESIKAKAAVHARKEANKLGDAAIAREILTADGDGPVLTVDQIATILKSEDIRNERSIVTEEEYRDRAAAIQQNPSQLARLAAGRSGGSGFNLNLGVVDQDPQPAGSPTPQPPPQTQPDGRSVQSPLSGLSRKQADAIAAERGETVYVVTPNGVVGVPPPPDGVAGG